ALFRSRSTGRRNPENGVSKGAGLPPAERTPSGSLKNSRNRRARDRGYLKSRNHRLFRQSTPAAALKILGIHKGFLRFSPCICLLLAKNSSISLFSETP